MSSAAARRDPHQTTGDDPPAAPHDINTRAPRATAPGVFAGVEAGPLCGGLGEWVTASCARQAIAVKVTDSVVVARVAVLFGSDLAGVASQPRTIQALSTRSEPPHGINPVGVEFPCPSHTGGDHRVIEHSTDDGVLAGQVEIRPLSA